MEATDHAREGDPLKRGEDGAEAGTASQGTELKKRSCKENFGLSKLTHWRTGVFFLSLFLCLIIVFAFSFIIPCPVRPQYLSTWNRTYSEAASYDFLGIEHASDDKVMDVVFVYKSTEGTQNFTCTGSGLPSPCVILSAVDGTDGETLWERPLSPEFHWAQCGLEKKMGRNWDCLVSHADGITAVDKRTAFLAMQTILSLLQTQLVLLSGKTGDQIGSTVILDSIEKANHLLHRTAGGSYYVLLQKDTGLYGLSLKRIAAKAGVAAGLQDDKRWEKQAVATSGFVPIYESDSVRHVLTKDESDDKTKFVVVSETEVAVVDARKLLLLWRHNTSSVLGLPSFGHFNKDNVLDVVIQEDIGNNTKRIAILDGKSGGVLWEVDLLASPNSPRPASIHTTNSVSVFMFWGVFSSQATSSVPLAEDRRSYMLHPLYSKVLLESTNVNDHIISFKATLMERGRHAAYILLTGPASEEADATVVLCKRKLKQDVPSSKVLPIGTEPELETDEEIKEAFNRLRFSDL
uniref:FAM234A/B beta-propeller domain-containing protein n=1 Tax=Gouania willdenowi TaxID=441366 RepID=A0A8C5GW53_GOUWI